MRLPGLERFVSNRKVQRKLVEFAQNKQNKKPPEGELVSYTGTTETFTQGIRDYISQYTPDKITTTTYGKMRMDAQINMGLQFCKLPILGLEFSIDCEDSKIAEAVEKEIRRIYRPLIDKMLRALDYGFSPMEKVWEYKDGLWVYDKFKDPKVDTITINVGEKGTFAGFTQSGIQKYVEPEKAFVFIHRLEHGNYSGISRLKPAYPYWYAHSIVMIQGNRYMERKGDPPRVVRYPPGTDTPTIHPNLDRAKALGDTFKGGSGVSLPNTRDEKGEYLWDINYVLDDKRMDMFLGYIKYLDAMKLRAVIVPERVLTQDTSTGSYSMAQTHADLFLLAEEGLIADIEEAINHFVIPPFVKYNFGDTAPPAIIDIAPITKENRQLLRDIVIELVKSMSFLPDIEQIAKEMNIPMPEKEEAETEMEREHIKLEKGKFWREPTEFEKKIDLKGIDNFLDTKQEEMRKNFGWIIDQMRDSTVRYITPILEKRDVKGINNFTLKYKSDYEKLFKRHLRECFDKGVDSVIKEFNAKVIDKSIPAKQTQWLLGRASSLAVKHTSDLEYKVKMTCLSGIDAEKTVKTIVFEVSELFEKHKKGSLETAIRTETVLCFNRGRQLIADELKGFRERA